MKVRGNVALRSNRRWGAVSSAMKTGKLGKMSCDTQRMSKIENEIWNNESSEIQRQIDGEYQTTLISNDWHRANATYQQAGQGQQGMRIQTQPPAARVLAWALPIWPTLLPRNLRRRCTPDSVPGSSDSTADGTKKTWDSEMNYTQIQRGT